MCLFRENAVQETNCRQLCFRGASVLNNASLSGEASLRGNDRGLDAVNEIV